MLHTCCHIVRLLHYHAKVQCKNWPTGKTINAHLSNCMKGLNIRQKHFLSFGNLSKLWSMSCCCLRIRAGWRDWLLLSSQSDCGGVAPDCGCRKAGNEPHQPGSAGRHRLLQIGSRWGAANWGWRCSHPLGEELQGVWKDKRREIEEFVPNLTAINFGYCRWMYNSYSKCTRIIKNFISEQTHRTLFAVVMRIPIFAQHTIPNNSKLNVRQMFHKIIPKTFDIMIQWNKPLC